MPADCAALKKRGAPATPSRSSSARAWISSSAARCTRSSGSEDPRRNGNADAAWSSTADMASLFLRYRHHGPGPREKSISPALQERRPDGVPCLGGVLVAAVRHPGPEEALHPVLGPPRNEV